MKTSLAAVYRGEPNRVDLEALALPVPEPGELLVRNIGCTICGSDLHTYSGRRTTPVPTILGHEIVGEVIAFGEDAPREDLAGAPIRLGDRVTWAIVASCGTCPRCTKGLPQKCTNGVKYGHIACAPGRELFGGYAEHCLLARGTAVMRIPDAMPLEVACPANCATSTAAAAIAAAIEEIGPLRGQSICVQGAGLVGLTTCAMAHAAGAAHIVAVEPRETRRALATQFGASATCPPQQLETVVTQTNGGDGFDVVFECAGPSENLRPALDAVRMGGVVVLVGSTYPDAPVAVQVDQLVRRNLRIRGVHNYTPTDLHAAVRFLEAHARDYPFAQLVNPWLPLTRIEDAFELAERGDSVRVGIDLSGTQRTPTTPA